MGLFFKKFQCCGGKLPIDTVPLTWGENIWKPCLFNTSYGGDGGKGGQGGDWIWAKVIKCPYRWNEWVMMGVISESSSVDVNAGYKSNDEWEIWWRNGCKMERECFCVWYCIDDNSGQDNFNRYWGWLQERQHMGQFGNKYKDKKNNCIAQAQAILGELSWIWNMITYSAIQWQ